MTINPVIAITIGTIKYCYNIQLISNFRIILQFSITLVLFYYFTFSKAPILRLKWSRRQNWARREKTKTEVEFAKMKLKLVFELRPPNHSISARELDSMPRIQRGKLFFLSPANLFFLSFSLSLFLSICFHFFFLFKLKEKEERKQDWMRERWEKDERKRTEN